MYTADEIINNAKGKRTNRRRESTHPSAAPKALSLNVSRGTIHNVVRNSPNIVRNIKQSEPYVKEHHMKLRAVYAEENVDRDWTKIIFSDEKKFNGDGPDGIHGYWHDKRKKPLKFKRRNFGGISVMCWGAISSVGTVSLAFCSSKMDSKEYINILNHHLLPFIRRHRAKKFLFQQDNAAIHTSSETSDWLKSKKINLISWPAKSPDLNIIENVWGIMARDVYKDGKQFDNKSDLQKAISDSWNRIGLSYLTQLYGNLKKRCLKIYQNKGAPIGY